uniref:Ig-like domain-containing protein n=1 Tax=Neolamprologus brichardi TaxID=32507 RepID=A0A3Q4MK49_NEOBR
SVFKSLSVCNKCTVGIDTKLSVTQASMFMKVGDDVTLPCVNVIDEQNNCDGTTWVFTSRNRETVELIKLGQIGEEAKTKSDRLSVTVNCSLVIKKLTVEDVGLYYCQQYECSCLLSTVSHQVRKQLRSGSAGNVSKITSNIYLIFFKYESRILFLIFTSDEKHEKLLCLNFFIYSGDTKTTKNPARKTEISTKLETNPTMKSPSKAGDTMKIKLTTVK